MHHIKYRRVKYNNKSTFNKITGRKYDSAGESDFATELYYLKKAGEIKDYEEQVRIPIKFNGILITIYKIDFKIYHNDRTIEYIEYKGFMDYASNIRWKCFCAYFANDPNVKCTLVKHKEKYNYLYARLNNKKNQKE